MQLAEIKDILRMYSQGLTGLDVRICSARDLVELAVGWNSSENATTDGTSIFLPESITHNEDDESNFELYKILTTHQVGHLEFGTFQFAFDKPSTQFEDVRQLLEQRHKVTGSPWSDFERYFDLFPDRILAENIFTIVEDYRIDCRLLVEYPGIRRPYGRFQHQSLRERPSLEGLSFPQAVLVCLSIFSRSGVLPPDLQVEWFPFLFPALQILERLRTPCTIVEDAAEATIRLYSLVSRAPNARNTEISSLEKETARKLQRIMESAENLADTFYQHVPLHKDMASPISHSHSNMEEQVSGRNGKAFDFRGDFKPELVQTILRLQKNQNRKEEVLPEKELHDALKQVFHKSVEVSIEVEPHSLDASEDVLLQNLLKEYGHNNGRQKLSPGIVKSNGGKPETNGMGKRNAALFHYDEWDYRKGVYVPAWCSVRQRDIEERNEDFFKETQREHRNLLNEVKRQFELLRFDRLKKEKRLRDGDEFDLDAGIEALVERRAGVPIADKLYTKRRKAERDVAVLFLLDMSGSTAEIARVGKDHDRQKMPKSIIDLEKESLVIMATALEAIGDRYGIYGFSGHGRNNVTFLTIKDIQEEFSNKVRRRFGAIRPFHATRMGPALRHATSILGKQDAKQRILFLLSDGRPRDFDYGVGPGEEEQTTLLGRFLSLLGKKPGRMGQAGHSDLYALQDTRMALLEAKNAGIFPFCLTVDRFGHDYLKIMCRGIAYEVLDRVESLPVRLPKLYRWLSL